MPTQGDRQVHKERSRDTAEAKECRGWLASLQKLRGGHGTELPPQPQEEPALWYLDFKLPAFRTGGTVQFKSPGLGDFVFTVLEYEYTISRIRASLILSIKVSSAHHHFPEGLCDFGVHINYGISELLVVTIPSFSFAYFLLFEHHNLFSGYQVVFSVENTLKIILLLKVLKQKEIRIFLSSFTKLVSARTSLEMTPSGFSVPEPKGWSGGQGPGHSLFFIPKMWFTLKQLSTNAALLSLIVYQLGLGLAILAEKNSV